jgi:hypothetical protein
MNEQNSVNLSFLKEKLSRLNTQRTNYIISILHGKEMVLGMPLRVYRKCGKKNCKCNTGKRHGPYPALSVNKQGKQKIVMIKKTDTSSVMYGAEIYKHYQLTLAKIRKIDKDINNILVQLKSDTTTDYIPT